jgi:hypothetical protein
VAEQDFHLRNEVARLFNFICDYTGETIAACLFAVGLALIALVLGLITWILWPWLWPKIRRGITSAFDWQVRKVFVWSRWRTHTEKSTGWAITAAWILTFGIALWVRLPFMRYIVSFIIPAALLTCFGFAYRNHGDRTFRSVRNFFNFSWSFWVPAVTAGAFAMFGVIAIYF